MASGPVAPPYTYPPPCDGNIRLLRPLPHRGGPDTIRAELFDCPLISSEGSYPYEALSYVWGSEEKPFSILLDGYSFPVGANLYAALSHLRGPFIERILWIDAICIDQSNLAEKGHQVRRMAEIYAKARTVIIWLGEPTVDSAQAIHWIQCAAGGSAMEKSANPEHAVLSLLQRPWFQRIWVVQEVAAARHIIVKCGLDEIEGHAFCLGLNQLQLSFEACPDLERLVRSATYLMRDAPLRPRASHRLGRNHVGRFSLDIRPLGELLDIFHSRKATRLHDKVYALVGMGSDDPVAAGLLIDYAAPWIDVFRSLVQFLFSDGALADTNEERELALVETRGRVVGFVSSVQINKIWADRWDVDIVWNLNHEKSSMVLPASAKPIHPGDTVCILDSGHLRLTFVRVHEDYCSVIRIAVPTPADMLRVLATDTRPRHEFLLAWDWVSTPYPPPNEEDNRGYFADSILPLFPPHGDFRGGARMNEGIRQLKVWNILLARDGEQSPAAKQSLPRLIQTCERYFSPAGQRPNDLEQAEMLRCQILGLGINQKQLLFEVAVEGGHFLTTELLLRHGQIDTDATAEKGMIPLVSAASRGHTNIVRLLLDTGNAKGETALFQACERNLPGAVRLLLNTKLVNPNAQDEKGRTPLRIALRHACRVVADILVDDVRIDVAAAWVQAVHDDNRAMAEYLLRTSKVDPKCRTDSGQTPLMWAAKMGYPDIASNLPLMAYLDARDHKGRTALMIAATSGNLDFTNWLVGSLGADTGIRDNDAKSALMFAAMHGRLNIAQLLAVKFRAEIDARDRDGKTALIYAAEHGHRDLVLLLLSLDADPTVTDSCGSTPATYAARWREAWKRAGHQGGTDFLTKVKGHELVFWAAVNKTPYEYTLKTLMGFPHIDPDTRDEKGQTPLIRAAAAGNLAGIKLLLGGREVNVNAKDHRGFTALMWAIVGDSKLGRMHDIVIMSDVVPYLIGLDGLDLEARNSRGETALLLAVRQQHWRAVKRLLRLGKRRADPDAEDNYGWSPRTWAKKEGDEKKFMECFRKPLSGLWCCQI